MTQKDYKLDSEEQEILDTFNREEWISKGDDLQKYREAAQKTFERNHQIDLRVSEKDFRGIQLKARKEGVSYQTLVSSVLHKYLSGQLREL